MKRFFLFSLAAAAIACNNAAKPVANTGPQPINAAQQTNEAKTVLAHTTENALPKSVESSGGKWSASGDAIDTTAADGKIASAEKALKGKPSDVEAKKALAEAYFERGFALTEARQYAAALGDYRRALKYDPDHEESKKWIDQIIGIYQMLKKEPPKEGEEPKPLPFKKT
jgi:tetratricopeptide (TPR) repeat protein